SWARIQISRRRWSHNLIRSFSYNGNQLKALSGHTDINIEFGFLKELGSDHLGSS
ncbi:1670_t:CDS:1, partial [Gigaspora rosea]